MAIRGMMLTNCPQDCRACKEETCPRATEMTYYALSAMAMGAPGIVLFIVLWILEAF